VADEEDRFPSPFPAADTTAWVDWPLPTAPLYSLLHHHIPVPRWGVRIYEENGPEHLWEDQPRVVTPEDLARWVASLIDEDVAVREMVEAMVTKHSEAFAPPPD
jgi:hypothetical protein